MKWFKHQSNMRNDHFVKTLRAIYGNEGYAVWNLLLEIFSDECGNDPDQELTFFVETLRKDLGISHRKLIEFLSFFQENSKVFWSFFGENLPKKSQKIKITIPKMRTIRDNYTKDVASNLQVNGKPYKEKEEDKEKDIRIKNPPTPQGGDPPDEKKLGSKPKTKRINPKDFEEFYSAYPKKIGPKPTEKAYIKARKTASHQEIMDGLHRYIAHLKKEGTEKRYIKQPTFWLNDGRWMDDYGSKLNTGPSKKDQILSAKKLKLPWGEQVFNREDFEPLVWGGKEYLKHTETGDKYELTHFEVVT